MINSVGAGAALPQTVKQAGAFGAPAQNQGTQAVNTGRAVGLAAKALVSQARDAGAELPNNIQGKAASSLARGIDPASLFAAVAGAPGAGDGAGDAAGDSVGDAPDVSPSPPDDAPGDVSTSADGEESATSAPGEQSESEQSPPPESPAQTLKPQTAGLAFLPSDFGQSGEDAALDILLGGNN